MSKLAAFLKKEEERGHYSVEISRADLMRLCPGCPDPRSEFGRDVWWSENETTEWASVRWETLRIDRQTGAVFFARAFPEALRYIHIGESAFLRKEVDDAICHMIVVDWDALAADERTAKKRLVPTARILFNPWAKSRLIRCRELVTNVGHRLGTKAAEKMLAKYGPLNPGPDADQRRKPLTLPYRHRIDLCEYVIAGESFYLVTDGNHRAAALHERDWNSVVWAEVTPPHEMALSRYLIQGKRELVYMKGFGEWNVLKRHADLKTARIWRALGVTVGQLSPGWEF